MFLNLALYIYLMKDYNASQRKLRAEKAENPLHLLE